MTDEQRVTDDGDLRKYRTELPNMADDELDPFDYRLYGHYKRVGDCWESVRTTASKTKMSTGQVVASRKSLEELGWIRCEDDAEHGTIRISIVDRWGENFQRFSGVHQMNAKTDAKRSPHEQQCSPGELKKEPVKKEPVKDSAPKPEKPKEHQRNPVYEAIADVFFGIKDFHAINGDGARVGKIWGWLKKVEPDVTPERVLAFGAWYDQETRNDRTGNSISRPKDLVKVQEWWARFKQAGDKPIENDPYTSRKRV